MEPQEHTSSAIIEIVTGKNDSKTLDAMIEMAYVVFDHNPRNIKQFVNTFRLQAFIANETGLFGNRKVARKTDKPLTIEQLGKFVALCMRWPVLVENASADDELVGVLETSVLLGKGDQTKVAPSDDGLSPKERWLSDRNLTALLSYGLPSIEFSLKDLNFDVLASISPPRAKSNFTNQVKPSNSRLAMESADDLV